MEAIIKKGRDWRVRDRAQTVLHFGDGWSAKVNAEMQELDLDTVYKRRKVWLERGFLRYPTGLGMGRHPS